MAMGRSPAASAAPVRRRTHALFIVCALLGTAWPLAAPAQNTSPPLAQSRLRISQASDLAGRHASSFSPNLSCSTWRIR